jgi:hypothetical protein
MNKNEVFDFIKSVIDYIDDGFCDEDNECVIHPLRRAFKPFELSFDSGITKLVLLIKGEPYVIKIPYHCYFNDDDYSNAYRDWEMEQDDELSRANSEEEKQSIIARFREDEPCEGDFYDAFKGAWCNSIDFVPTVAPMWDYCALETAIYQEAAERGFGTYFAEEGILGFIGDHPVYYQTRCIPFSDTDIDWNSEEVKKKSNKSEEICKKLGINCFNSIWIADFIAAYGEDELSRLDGFLSELRIGDLRDCNIGYLDGAPILFDYSGYREWE